MTIVSATDRAGFLHYM